MFPIFLDYHKVSRVSGPFKRNENRPSTICPHDNWKEGTLENVKISETIVTYQKRHYESGDSEKCLSNFVWTLKRQRTNMSEAE